VAALDALFFYAFALAEKREGRGWKRKVAEEKDTRRT